MLSLATLAALEEDLLSQLAQADLSAANTLPLLTQLRKTYPPEIAAAALETARLRQKATVKFSRASQMFFTSDALQQATHESVSAYHAQKLAHYSHIADLGCGIGGDSLAFGQNAQVIGVDLDVLRLHMARHNTRIYEANANFIQADLSFSLPLKNIPVAFFDPARRDDSKRIFSVKDYMPPLAHISAWDFESVLVKISPGVQLEEIAHLKVGIEFVSYEGDLKEALLCAGEMRFEGRRAVRLPENEILTPLGYEPPPLTAAPHHYLYEPDPSVIRSGLLSELLEKINLVAYRLDEEIAYLTGDECVENCWLRTWRIDEWMPFNLKKLRARLREKQVGQITVKKRGSPITPEQLQQMLRLKQGNRHATVILTQLKGQPIVLVSYEN